MREIRVRRDISASQTEVWDVLADFPNISSWNRGVKNSYATSEAVEGVGAQRHCDLAPAGALDETIAEWGPPSRLVIKIDSAKKLPIQSALVTFTVGEDAASAPTEIIYRYDTKWGIVGKLMGPMLDRQLTKGFDGFLEDVEAAANP